jgi:hypothetical protein
LLWAIQIDRSVTHQLVYLLFKLDSQLLLLLLKLFAYLFQYSKVYLEPTLVDTS